MLKMLNYFLTEKNELRNTLEMHLLGQAKQEFKTFSFTPEAFL